MYIYALQTQKQVLMDFGWEIVTFVHPFLGQGFYKVGCSSFKVINLISGVY